MLRGWFSVWPAMLKNTVWTTGIVPAHKQAPGFLPCMLFLPFLSRNMTSVQLHHLFESSPWKREIPGAICSTPGSHRNYSRGKDNHLRTAKQTWAQSWDCTVLNTALIHPPSHLFPQTYIHAQSRLQSTQWTDCAQPHTTQSLLGWLCFA